MTESNKATFPPRMELTFNELVAFLRGYSGAAHIPLILKEDDPSWAVGHHLLKRTGQVAY